MGTEGFFEYISNRTKYFVFLFFLLDFGLWIASEATTTLSKETHDVACFWLVSIDLARRSYHRDECIHYGENSIVRDETNRHDTN